MGEKLLSVGLDVGTTSTQMIFSELTVENKASGFAVPEMEIARRDIRYCSPVYFTPLLDESHVDAEALRELVAEEYRKAGIRRESVDTGAIIITGETSRKENARAVLDALQGSGLADHPEVDVREYIYDMPLVMAAADLVLCRAGASTIAEIAARYGISESAVQMRLSRTRAKLSTYLEKEGIEV